MNFGISLGFGGMNTGFRGLKPASQNPKEVEEQKGDPRTQQKEDNGLKKYEEPETQIENNGQEKDIYEQYCDLSYIRHKERTERLIETNITKLKDVLNKYFNS